MSSSHLCTLLPVEGAILVPVILLYPSLHILHHVIVSRELGKELLGCELGRTGLVEEVEHVGCGGRLPARSWLALPEQLDRKFTYLGQLSAVLCAAWSWKCQGNCV